MGIVIARGPRVVLHGPAGGQEAGGGGGGGCQGQWSERPSGADYVKGGGARAAAGGAGALEGARRARRARKGTGKLVGASAL